MWKLGKVAALGVMLAALASCDNTGRRDVAQCRMDSHKIYPGRYPADHNPTWLFLMNCMEAKGYEYRGAFGLCSQQHMITDPSCWQTSTESLFRSLIRIVSG